MLLSCKRPRPSVDHTGGLGRVYGVQKVPQIKQFRGASSSNLKQELCSLQAIVLL